MSTVKPLYGRQRNVLLNYFNEHIEETCPCLSGISKSIIITQMLVSAGRWTNEKSLFETMNGLLWTLRVLKNIPYGIDHTIVHDLLEVISYLRIGS